MGLTVILVGLFYLGQNSDFSALKRLKRDESNLFDNREEAHYFAKKLIEQNYWLGSGLDAYNGVDSNNPIYRGHTEIGPHNSYYAFLIAYGVPLGSALSFFIIFTVLRYVYLIRVKKEFYISNKILFIPFLLILVSFTETFLTGINEVITLFFWYFLNLIYLEYRNSKQIQLTKNEKHPYIRESRGNVSVGAAVGSL
jgi:O-antigen ligase